MTDPKAMQRLCGLMRKAVQDYEMISPGDRVMVGVSGGKDSVALTVGLAMLKQYIGFDYDVVAVTLDPQFDHQPMDYTALQALFARYGVPYEIRRTEIGPIVFEYRQEKNPCALCAKLRRGALHTAAQELGCNKVALGHHLDDAVETFYMNLWREGRIGCFSPVTYLSRRDLTLIRPMLLATEYEVQCAVREAGLPIVKSRCPVLGRVCMDQLMVDVTAVPDVHEDEEAILWGGTVSDTAETIARKTGTIPYEILCGVSRRVPRVYRSHGQIVAVENWILEA